MPLQPLLDFISLRMIDLHFEDPLKAVPLLQAIPHKPIQLTEIQVCCHILRLKPNGSFIRDNRLLVVLPGVEGHAKSK